MAIKKIAQGLTLLEILVVMSVIALGSAGVALAMRDSQQALVEREALRLSALLDSARSQSRTTGKIVTWESSFNTQNQAVMKWSGLTRKEPLPTTWLDTKTQAYLLPNRPLILGPDPLIAPQRIRIVNQTQSVHIVTDGVSSFRMESSQP